MCALAGLQLNVLGHVVENFVVMECVKQATWSTANPRLYHYRQEKGSNAEVDLILEASGTGKIVGIEIKLSSVIRPEDVRGLKSLKEAAGDSFHRGIILHMGDRVLPFGEKIEAVPISALWHNAS